MDEAHQCANRRGVDTRVFSQFGDGSDLRIHLRAALAHSEIAPDSRMGLGGVPVEFREMVLAERVEAVSHSGDASQNG